MSNLQIIAQTQTNKDLAMGTYANACKAYGMSFKSLLKFALISTAKTVALAYGKTITPEGVRRIEELVTYLTPDA